MNCGYGEKLILYFYGEAAEAGEFLKNNGEAGAALRAEVESHLAACADCRAELETLERVGAWLSERPGGPSRAAEAAVMAAARAQASHRRGFAFSWREALLSGALAAVMAGVFAVSGGSASADLAWNSGLDSKLDSVEYSVYQAQAEMSSASGDWEYSYSALEDEGLRAGKNIETYKEAVI